MRGWYAVDVAAVAEEDALLKAHVHAVDRLAHELRAVEVEVAVEGLALHLAIAQRAERRRGRAGRRQDVEAGASGAPEIAAPAGAAALAGAEEVEAAQLHSLAHIPDAVERCAVPLVGRRELVNRPHVGRHRSGVRG